MAWYGTMLSGRRITVYGDGNIGEMRGEGCPVTIGRHGNRLHRLTAPCIPHGCSPSLRAELHPGGMGEREERRGERERTRDGGTLNFGADKCGGTETGFETRETDTQSPLARIYV